MTNRKSTNELWSAHVTPKSPKGGSKTDFQFFFGIKFNFSRIKSATKFHCVKTSSGKVVGQSICYEITEKCSVFFYLKYWLKLTYPVVASIAHVLHVGE